MRIPLRIHRDLPGDVAWVITERCGQLIVYLADDIPADSVLEQQCVRQAVRAWQHRQPRGGLGWVMVAAAGTDWLVRQFRRPAVAAGTAVAVAGVALAVVTVVEPHQPGPRRPPSAAAPPSHTPTRQLPPYAAPSHPPAPKPQRPRPPEKAQPRQAGRVSGLAVSVSVPAAGRVRLPVRVPPVKVRTHVSPPDLPDPPVTVPPVPPPAVESPTSSCRLVRVEVGRLVRVCL